MPSDEKTDRGTGTGRANRLLPLILLASMMGIASILEPLLFGSMFFLTKMPLAILLAWAFIRPTGRRGHAPLP